jgi:hypothetical protein
VKPPLLRGPAEYIIWHTDNTLPVDHVAQSPEAMQEQLSELA